VPTTYVSITALADAGESGTEGVFRVSRTGGNTALPLTIGMTLSGTATSGTDYSALPSSVTIPANESSVDVELTALPDYLYDPDETATVTLSGDVRYYLLSNDTASVSILDDSNTVTTTVHEEEFTLTGAAGSVNVALTVTYNPSGAMGQYEWKYVVTNPSSSSASWTDLSIPVDDIDSDVGNLTSSIGWTGTVGTSAVSWAGGTALAPGNSATFTIRSDPRELIPVTGSILNGAAQAQGDVKAPGPLAVAPRATLSFFNGTQHYKLALKIKTASGAEYDTQAIPINLGSGTTARDFVYDYLKDAGWVVEKIGDLGITIRGVKKPDGTTDAIKSIVRTITDRFEPQGAAPAPTVQGVVGVTATNYAE
jgi:hypothetical protein